MSGWRTAALHKVATIERDVVEAAKIEDATAYVGLENIESGGKLIGVREVDSGELASSKFNFTARHLLYGKLRPYLAKIARPEFEGICSTDILPVLPGPELDRNYLAHFLLQPSMVAFANSRAAGANLPRLSPRTLAEFQIPLPPLTEQRRIAVVLDRTDTLVAKRRAALAQLDSLTQSIFLDMFGDPGSGAVPFPTVKLGSVLSRPLQNGAYYPKEKYTSTGGVEMVHMSDAFGGVVARGCLKRVDCNAADTKKYGLSTSDILLARRSLTYEGAAKPCLIPASEEPLVFESSFIRVTPDDTRLTHLYLFHYLNNARVREIHLRPFVTQSTISGINQSNLEQVQIVVPPLPLQQAFARRITAIEALKTTQRSALAELDALFASLQHRAFRGEL
jgi:type I restriction enzyme S subunit